jgi:hypothetical protein
MTQRTEQYQKHQLWDSLKNLGPSIDEAFNRDEIDAVSLDNLGKLKTVLTYVGCKLAGYDPYLIPIALFDNLNNVLTHINQEVRNFITNGNATHLSAANSHADSVLTYIAQVNIQVTTEDFFAAKEAADAYRYGLEKALEAIINKKNLVLSEITSSTENLKTDIKELKTNTTNIAQELSSERTKLSEIVANYQNQFSQAQESRNNTFATGEKERQDRYSSLFNEYTLALNEHNMEFIKQHAAIERTHLNSLEELKKEFVDTSSKLYEDMHAHKTEIEKLVGVIGNLGVTSGYLKAANADSKRLGFWQGITVAAMAGLIAIAYFKFLPLADKTADFTWPGFSIRVFVALSIGALATYAGAQADKYHKSERYNRRLALELEAIGPYIAPLEEEKQHDFRIKIGERTFGQGETHHKFDSKSPTNLIEALADPEKKNILTSILDLIRHK